MVSDEGSRPILVGEVVSVSIKDPIRLDRGAAKPEHSSNLPFQVTRGGVVAVPCLLQRTIDAGTDVDAVVCRDGGTDKIIVARRIDVLIEEQ